MQNNELYSKRSVEQSQQEDVNLGTFKSVKSLKEAYDCLRKTFTQNAMELAKYKKDLEKTERNPESESVQQKSENVQNVSKNKENSSKISSFNDDNTISEDNKMSDKVDSTPDNNVQMDKVKTPICSKYESEEWQNKVQQFFLENQDAMPFASEIGRIIMQDKSIQNSAEPLDKAWIKVLKTNVAKSIDEAMLEKLALQNENIKQKIIEQYLSELQHKKSTPKVIAEKTGTQLSAGKTFQIRSMKDAKEMAKKILIK